MRRPCKALEACINRLCNLIEEKGAEQDQRIERLEREMED